MPSGSRRVSPWSVLWGVAAMLWGCGDATPAPAPDGGARDAPPEVQPDTAAAPGDAAVCCPVYEGPPMCGCVDVGGTRQAGRECQGVCDSNPSQWVRRVDANGCPELVVGGGSCLSTDAGP